MPQQSKAIPKIPDGMVDLMKNLAKNVLKEQPENIYLFAAEYFENLLRERDGSLEKGYETFRQYEDNFQKRKGKVEGFQYFESQMKGAKASSTTINKQIDQANGIEINGVAIKAVSREQKLAKLPMQRKKRLDTLKSESQDSIEDDDKSSASSNKTIDATTALEKNEQKENEGEDITASRRPRTLSSRKPSQNLIAIQEENPIDIEKSKANVKLTENAAASIIQGAMKLYVARKQAMVIDKPETPTNETSLSDANTDRTVIENLSHLSMTNDESNAIEIASEIELNSQTKLIVPSDDLNMEKEEITTTITKPSDDEGAVLKSNEIKGVMVNAAKIDRLKTPESDSGLSEKSFNLKIQETEETAVNEKNAFSIDNDVQGNNENQSNANVSLSEQIEISNVEIDKSNAKSNFAEQSEEINKNVGENHSSSKDEANLIKPIIMVVEKDTIDSSELNNNEKNIPNVILDTEVDMSRRMQPILDNQTGDTNQNYSITSEIVNEATNNNKNTEIIQVKNEKEIDDTQDPNKNDAIVLKNELNPSDDSIDEDKSSTWKNAIEKLSENIEEKDANQKEMICKPHFEKTELSNECNEPVENENKTDPSGIIENKSSPTERINLKTDENIKIADNSIKADNTHSNDEAEKQTSANSVDKLLNNNIEKTDAREENNENIRDMNVTALPFQPSKDSILSETKTNHDIENELINLTNDRKSLIDNSKVEKNENKDKNNTNIKDIEDAVLIPEIVKTNTVFIQNEKVLNKDVNNGAPTDKNMHASDHDTKNDGKNNISQHDSIIETDNTLENTTNLHYENDHTNSKINLNETKEDQQINNNTNMSNEKENNIASDEKLLTLDNQTGEKILAETLQFDNNKIVEDENQLSPKTKDESNDAIIADETKIADEFAENEIEPNKTEGSLLNNGENNEVHSKEFIKNENQTNPKNQNKSNEEVIKDKTHVNDFNANGCKNNEISESNNSVHINDANILNANSIKEIIDEEIKHIITDKINVNSTVASENEKIEKNMMNELITNKSKDDATADDSSISFEISKEDAENIILDENPKVSDSETAYLEVQVSSKQLNKSIDPIKENNNDIRPSSNANTNLNENIKNDLQINEISHEKIQNIATEAITQPENILKLNQDTTMQELDKKDMEKSAGAKCDDLNNTNEPILNSAAINSDLKTNNGILIENIQYAAPEIISKNNIDDGMSEVSGSNKDDSYEQADTVIMGDESVKDLDLLSHDDYVELIQENKDSNTLQSEQQEEEISSFNKSQIDQIQPDSLDGFVDSLEPSLEPSMEVDSLIDNKSIDSLESKTIGCIVIGEDADNAHLNEHDINVTDTNPNNKSILPNDSEKMTENNEALPGK